MIKALSKFSNIERFNAIIPSNPIFERHNYGHIKTPAYNFDLGHKVICCLLSHLYVIKRAFDQNLEQAIIFEDDVDLSIFDKVYDNLLLVMSKNNDVDIIQIVTSNPKGKEISPCNKYNLEYENIYNVNNNTLELLDRKKQYWGCLGYIINRNGMKKFMNYYDKRMKRFDIFKAKCFLWSDVLLYHVCNSKILNVPLISIYDCDKFKSNLENDNEKSVKSYTELITFFKNNKDYIIKTMNDYC